MSNVAGLPQLRESRFGLVEFKRQTFHVVPEEGTAFEDILKPEFWSHVAYQMKTGCIVEVHAEDGSYFAELYVQHAERLFAKVAVLRKVDFEGFKADAGAPEFEIEWKGPHRKFAVIRKADREILKDGFSDKTAAGAYIESHTKAMAA